MPKRITLVTVQAPLHRQHPASGEMPGNQPTGMRLHRGQRESGDVVIVEDHPRFDARGEGAESRAQDDRDLRARVDAGTNDRSGFLDPLELMTGGRIGVRGQTPNSDTLPVTSTFNSEFGV